jgi:hypothetical protein
MPPQRATRTPIRSADDLDNLSAIWILSCIDENPIMTYRGLSDRLDLPDSYDVKALVRGRRELFRPKVLPSRFREWKAKMENGLSLPAWVAEIEDDVARAAAIKNISRDDVFRNQFRTAKDAPKCDIETIDWGLSHLERLRKSTTEEREEWTSKVATVIIPFLSILPVLASLGWNLYLQKLSLSQQGQTNHYKVSFKPKQDAYSKLMMAITNTAIDAQTGNKANLEKRFSDLDESYYQIEPFLNSGSRQALTQRIADYKTLSQQRAGKTIDLNSDENNRFNLAVKNAKDFVVKSTL